MALARRAQFRIFKNLIGPVIQIRSKHYNPKFKWLRGKKFITLGTDFDKKQTPEELKEMFTKLGGLHLRYSKEIPFYVDSTMTVFDPYKPTEGDGKYTNLKSKIMSTLTVKESLKRKNFLAYKKFRNFLPTFDWDKFAMSALDIYTKAHLALASKDVLELEKYATDYAIIKMTQFTKNVTIRWKYLESLDPPRTVQLRINDETENMHTFGQATVRFHSKQTLAMYDRFGRLMCGSEIIAKDVLEYGVFEIHFTNVNGCFKLHDKIIPDWLEPNYNMTKTYREVNEAENESEARAA